MSNRVPHLPGLVLLLMALIKAFLLHNFGLLIGFAIGIVLLYLVSQYEKYRRAKYVEKMEL